MIHDREVFGLLLKIRVQTKQVGYALEARTPILLKLALDDIESYVGQIRFLCEAVRPTLGQGLHRPGCPKLDYWDANNVCTCHAKAEYEDEFDPDAKDETEDDPQSPNFHGF